MKKETLACRLWNNTAQKWAACKDRPFKRFWYMQIMKTVARHIERKKRSRINFKTFFLFVFLAMPVFFLWGLLIAASLLELPFNVELFERLFDNPLAAPTFAAIAVFFGLIEATKWKRQ